MHNSAAPVKARKMRGPKGSWVITPASQLPVMADRATGNNLHLWAIV